MNMPTSTASVVAAMNVINPTPTKAKDIPRSSKHRLRRRFSMAPSPAIGSDRGLLTRSRSRARGECRRGRCNRSVLRQSRQVRLFLTWQLIGDAHRTGTQNLRRDHHDQLGTVLLRSLAAEQEAENRDIADARELLHR